MATLQFVGVGAVGLLVGFLLGVLVGYVLGGDEPQA